MLNTQEKVNECAKTLEMWSGYGKEREENNFLNKACIDNNWLFQERKT